MRFVIGAVNNAALKLLGIGILGQGRLCPAFRGRGFVLVGGGCKTEAVQVHFDAFGFFVLVGGRRRCACGFCIVNAFGNVFLDDVVEEHRAAFRAVFVIISFGGVFMGVLIVNFVFVGSFFTYLPLRPSASTIFASVRAMSTSLPPRYKPKVALIDENPVLT